MVVSVEARGQCVGDRYRESHRNSLQLDALVEDDGEVTAGWGWHKKRCVTHFLEIEFAGPFWILQRTKSLVLSVAMIH